MDVPRTPPDRRKRRILWTAGSALALGAVTFGLSRLQPAAPRVDAATLWIDTVKRGSFTREVRAPGTLVPEEIRWVAAASDGRIDRLPIQPGAAVEVGTPLAVLVNPELEVAAKQAELDAKAAEADLAALRVRLQHELLDQKATAAGVEADYTQARLQADADEELARQGLLSALNLKFSEVHAQELATRKSLEDQRLASAEDSLKAQLAAQTARVDQLRAMAELRDKEVDGLVVRADLRGVLQEVPVQLGQRVTAGTILARLAQPEKLKAALKVPETQARDIAVGLTAEIDTHDGVVAGHVLRVDPAVLNGTVTVDVALDGAPPKGARPDLSVDGTIELEKVENVLYVGRPAFGQPESSIGVFRLSPGGDEAKRVTVALGRGSTHLIEIRDGLAEGDRVILSDMSAWDAVDRVRLN